MEKVKNKAKAAYKAKQSQKRYEARMRAQNSLVAGRSGQGGVQDRGSWQRLNNITSHPLDRNRNQWARAREWVNLYHKEWTVKKIVQIPVDDMLRESWSYKNLNEDQAAAIEKNMLKLHFKKSLRNALRLERLIGGAVLLMGLRDTEDDPSKPLDYATIQQGDLQFVNMIPRTRISNAEWENNPLSPNFGKPKSYSIDGQHVHESRLLIFDGDPITDNPKSELTYLTVSNDGFGESVIAPIYDDIMRSVGSRQAANHLIQRASVLLIQNQSMQQMLESDAGQEAMQKLDNIADQMDIYQAAMIDGKKVNVDQWSASFGSVPELLMQFLQIISAASDIPATRFLGQAPGGLNATGESDLENYYNMIEAQRETRLRFQLEKFLQVQMRSLFGNAFDESMLEIEFDPLWNLSEEKLAAIRAQDAANITNAYNSGLIDGGFANRELKEREVWLNEPDPEMLGDSLALEGQDESPDSNILESLKQMTPEQ
jgi:phage-related protein (TIGR01555 family)